VAFLRDQANTYVNDNVPPQKAGRDALADLCQMLIASNEFLYVE
jgi:hypothetical protein